MSLSIELLEKSLNQVRPRADEFAASFYRRLFTICPHIKPMFAHIDIAEQEKRLMLSLVLIVYNIRRPEALDYMLTELGIRHIRYGAKAEHYNLVAQALLDTFAEYLGADWNEAVKASWVEAYQFISGKMLEKYEETSYQSATISSEKKPEPWANYEAIALKIQTSDNYFDQSLDLNIEIPKEEQTPLQPDVPEEKIASFNNLLYQSEIKNHVDISNNRDKLNVVPEKLDLEINKDVNHNLIQPKVDEPVYTFTVEEPPRLVLPTNAMVMAGGWLSTIFLLIYIMMR